MNTDKIKDGFNYVVEDAPKANEGRPANLRRIPNPASEYISQGKEAGMKALERHVEISARQLATLEST